jgi:hypothetical protein
MRGTRSTICTASKTKEAKDAFAGWGEKGRRREEGDWNVALKDAFARWREKAGWRESGERDLKEEREGRAMTQGAEGGRARGEGGGRWAMTEERRQEGELKGPKWDLKKKPKILSRTDSSLPND